MKKKAVFIKQAEGMNGDARLYKCDPPFESIDWKESPVRYEYVVVSAVSSFLVYETYIFPSNKRGEIVDWGELDGSFQGGTDHAQALENAGYEIVNN